MALSIAEGWPWYGSTPFKPWFSGNECAPSVATFSTSGLLGALWRCEVCLSSSGWNRRWEEDMRRTWRGLRSVLRIASEDELEGRVKRSNLCALALAVIATFVVVGTEMCRRPIRELTFPRRPPPPPSNLPTMSSSTAVGKKKAVAKQLSPEGVFLTTQIIWEFLDSLSEQKSRRVTPECRTNCKGSRRRSEN